MKTAREVAEIILNNLEDSSILKSLDSSRRDQVLAFHRLYDCPIHEGEVTKDISHMSVERLALRLGLILEEVQELLRDGFGVETEIYYSSKHYASGYYKDLTDALRVSREDDQINAVEAYDALGDISYVVDGLAIEMGGNLDRVIDEIHASNLTKLAEDGSVILREDGKVLKGPNYTPPNIQKVVMCT